jgi:hypothetical protein
MLRTGSKLSFVQLVLRLTIIARTIVAIGKIKIDGKETNLVVIFTKKEDEIYIVTAYPVRDIEKEIKSKEGKRWIRIRM